MVFVVNTVGDIMKNRVPLLLVFCCLASGVWSGEPETLRPVDVLFQSEAERDQARFDSVREAMEHLSNGRHVFVDVLGNVNLKMVDGKIQMDASQAMLRVSLGKDVTAEDLRAAALLKPEYVEVSELPVECVPLVALFSNCRCLDISGLLVADSEGKRPLKNAELKFLLEMPTLEELRFTAYAENLCAEDETHVFHETVSGHDSEGKETVEEISMCAVSCEAISTEGADAFQNLKKLRRLRMCHCEPDAIVRLAELLPKLEVWSIGSVESTQMTPSDFFNTYDFLPVTRAIAKMKHLRALTLGNAPWMTWKTLKPLTECESLEYLGLPGRAWVLSEKTGKKFEEESSASLYLRSSQSVAEMLGMKITKIDTTAHPEAADMERKSAPELNESNGGLIDSAERFMDVLLEQGVEE